MIKYIKIDVKLKKNSIKPLPFIGSTLRGAFGVSLKKIVCLGIDSICENNCLYCDFFEKKNKAHQYRFEFELDQDSYDFSLYIFEEATQKLPYVVSAIHNMLTVQGLTKARETFEIDSMMCNAKLIYRYGEVNLQGIKAKELMIDETLSSINLKFVTPLRMKYRRKLLHTKPPLEMVLYSIQARLNEIKNLPRERLPFVPHYKELTSKIEYRDQTRLSNRQKTKMQIGGIVGNIVYKELDKESFRLLKLGEILGVGKQTSFGMGRIEIFKIL